MMFRLLKCMLTFSFPIGFHFPLVPAGGFGFCQIPGYEHDEFEYKVWEIKLTIPLFNYDEWQAFVKPPQLYHFQGSFY